jgi:hypothetical protein
MRYLRIHKITGNVFAVTLSVLAGSTALAGPSAASTTAASALLYNYGFKGTTGTVPNSAPNGPAAPLTLTGAWKPVTQGVHFGGNMSGRQSVAYGRPASGYTLNEPASAAIGVGTRIVYQAPPPGTCFAGAPNITQIGLYSATHAAAQAKLQESGCSVSTTQVMIECRFTGAKSASTTPPVTSTLPLVNSRAYNITCVKSPDMSNGTTTITLTVTRIKGRLTVTNKFTVPAMGALQTKQFVTAGNKFPLSKPAKNIDQFNGDMTRTIYCAGTLAAVNSCMATYLPK